MSSSTIHGTPATAGSPLPIEPQPTFENGEVVYLKESAKLGFLEAYKIHNIVIDVKGIISYSTIYYSKPPFTQPVGDAIDLRTDAAEMWRTESELLSECGALEFIINFHYRNYHTNLNKYNTLCGSGSS